MKSDLNQIHAGGQAGNAVSSLGTIGWTGLVIRAELPRALQHEDVVPKSALKFNVIHQYH